MAKQQINAERQRLENQRAGTRELAAVGPVSLRTRPGARCARTTASTATPGSILTTTRPARAPTAGTRTAWAAICDEQQRLCLAFALWNGRDPILKERAFGLTGNQGNHGEDVKEYYFYLDATPSHSYLRYLYKYPQGAYPYAWSGGGERAARAPAIPPSACSTPVSSETPLLGRGGALRQSARPRRSTSA